MEKITFECEVITPMFLAGADGVTPELRAPSIKGALRFWWRALNGHLSLSDLKKLEGQIFGDTSRKSNFLINITPKDIREGKLKPVLHKPYVVPCILEGSTFEVTFRIPNVNKYWDMEKCSKLFELVTILGGFGKRVRRGMGSLNIISCDMDNTYPARIDLPYIFRLISSFSNFYVLSKDKIYFNFSGKPPKYGYITEIQLGKHQNNLLRLISNTTHEIKSKNKYKYDPSLGHASKSRFASPIYVSVVKGSTKPIITTLNTAPDKNEHNVSPFLQEEFKNRIL